jgi:GntR family transcriptional regulator
VARATAYRDLADRMVADIGAGRYPVGCRLPTDAELCAETGLSRGTVRRALGLVSDLGLISRRPGDGSRVIATAPLDEYRPVFVSTDDIVAASRRTRIEPASVRDVVADAALARRLRVRRGSKWHLIEGPRVRVAGDDTPLCWSEHYVLYGSRGVEIIQRGSYTDAEAAIGDIEQIVRAEPLEASLAARLRTDSRVALVVTRRRRDADGRMLAVSIHTHPADRHELRSVVRKKGERLP